MIKMFTCIVCPNGCDIEANIAGTEIASMEGARCARGEEYVARELCDPQRNIASSVLVDGGELPLASVRLSEPIPKNRIFDVMNVIRNLRITAPVSIGDVLVPDILGLGSDVVATKNNNRLA